MDVDEASDWWEEHCSVYPPEALRLFLVGILGTLTALVSLVFNGFLFILFVKNPQHRRSHFVYLMVLALIDAFLSASYILLFPWTIFMDLFESVLLAQMWWAYVRPMLSISHVAITASALLLLAATFERYVTISKIRSQFSRRFRLTLMLIAVSFALLTKGPMFAEYEIVRNGNCTGVTMYTIMPSEWSERDPYSFVYKFCFRTIVSTFLPFFLSLHFNCRIVSRLRQQTAGARLFRFATSEHRKNIRAATRMLVSISTTYLACNLLSVLIACWEFIDKDSLFTPTLRPLYTYSTDLVSLLTLTSCASRLPIYYKCNRRIRKEVNWVLLRLCYCGTPSRRFSRENTNMGGTLRYLNTGNGYVFYNASGAPLSPNEKRHLNGQCFGTNFDKVVLQVAMGMGNLDQSVRRMNTQQPMAQNNNE